MYSSQSSKHIQRIGRKRANGAWNNRSMYPCTDKECYPTKAAADRAVTRMLRDKNNAYAVEVRSYCCSKCGRWHIERKQHAE